MKGATKGHILYGFTYVVFTESRPVETENRSVGARGKGEYEGTFGDDGNILTQTTVRLARLCKAAGHWVMPLQGEYM